jgi:hypothetical protein
VVPGFNVSGKVSLLPSTQGELASLWEQREADIVSVKACLSDSTACVEKVLVSGLGAGNAGTRVDRDKPAPGSTRSASGARAQVEHLHGDHHPAVSIKFNDPGLVYKYDENGTVSSMEVHAWVTGCVVGFSYLVVVQAEEGKSWMQDLTMLDSASSLHVAAVFADSQPSVQHRFR